MGCVCQKERRPLQVYPEANIYYDERGQPFVSLVQQNKEILVPVLEPVEKNAIIQQRAVNNLEKKQQEYLSTLASRRNQSPLR